MATVAESIAPPGVLFDGMTWDDYETQLRIIGDRPVRVTYDCGRMEVFMPSRGHEDDAYLLGRMIDTLTEELDIAMEAGGATTHKRQDLDRGAEPDQCYWFRVNAAAMIGKRQLDLAVDPSPDLVVEVDVTSTSLQRLPIFAAMGVPEVWRVVGGRLDFLHLDAEGNYNKTDRSRNFPALTVTDAARFLDEGRRSDKNTWIRRFRIFVRDVLAPRPPENQGGG